MKKGQAWSLDLIIAVIIFVLMISILYSVLNREATTDVVQLQFEANNVAAKIKDGSGACNFITGNVINVDKLKECYRQDIEITRQELGIINKFCIYIEDKDGRVIYLEDRPGTGDSELIIGPSPCGKRITS